MHQVFWKLWRVNCSNSKFAIFQDEWPLNKTYYKGSLTIANIIALVLKREHWLQVSRLIRVNFIAIFNFYLYIVAIYTKIYQYKEYTEETKHCNSINFCVPPYKLNNEFNRKRLYMCKNHLTVTHLKQFQFSTTSRWQIPTNGIETITRINSQGNKAHILRNILVN